MSRYERQEKSVRKHSPSVSGAAKAPGPPPVQRPGWKGPSFVKKTQRQPTRPSQSSNDESSGSTIQENILPLELQQLLLNIFRNTFPASQSFETLKPVLQEVKGALFDRDFDRAFGSRDFLEAYAVRWSPSRSLGYANVLAWICGKWDAEVWTRRLLAGAEGRSRAERVVCFGGGAAEIMAFAGLMRAFMPDCAGRPVGQQVAEKDVEAGMSEAMSSLAVSPASPSAPQLNLHLVDTADWSPVVEALAAGLTTPPPLSKYASTSARASNASFLLADSLATTFQQADVLKSNIEELKAMIGPRPVLLTLLFTLNELYTASIPSTTAFLLKLTLAAAKDTLLLVVDSPGSYSQTAVKSSTPAASSSNNAADKADGDKEEKEVKKYPMHWMMDHVLLEKGKKKVRGEEETGPMWEKLVGEDSRWFRLDEALRYPVSLENMRMQVHLFRRL